jgi:hypothetical protein
MVQGKAKRTQDLACDQKTKPRNAATQSRAIFYPQNDLCFILRSILFFHPDYTVGFGIAPNHALRLVGFTTGRDLHPALKIIFSFTRASIHAFRAPVKKIILEMARPFVKFPLSPFGSKGRKGTPPAGLPGNISLFFF